MSARSGVGVERRGKGMLLSLKQLHRRIRNGLMVVFSFVESFKVGFMANSFQVDFITRIWIDVQFSTAIVKHAKKYQEPCRIFGHPIDDYLHKTRKMRCRMIKRQLLGVSR